MVVTPETVVVDVDPDMTITHWTRILADANSPAADVPSAGYAAVVANRVSPAFALAIANHESRFGRAGIVPQYDLRNPGATRSTRTGVGKVIQIPGRGPFVKYPNWMEGWRDAAFRLVDPQFVYVREGRRTIRQIIERWAPASDGNAPASYVAAVVADMNRWIEEEQPLPEWTPPPIIRRILPRDASNTPRRRMAWEYLTVHNTGNPRPTADALAHAAWLESLARAGASEPSWGYTVDDTRIVQHLEDDQAGWHASDGNGPGNLQSIGIELVEVGDQERVLRNAAWLAAQQLHGRGFGIERCRQHHDWARDKKNCPRLLRANGGAGWQRLLSLIETELRALDTPVRWFPETGHGIGHAFRSCWEQFQDDALSIRLFGYPLTNEVQEAGRTAQYFERVVFEWWPENAEPHKVQLRRLGAEALERRGR